MSWIKIDKEVFNVDSISIQSTIGSHSTIYFSLDITINNKYYDQIVKISDNISKFTIISPSFIAYVSYIKAMDIDFENGKMNLTISADYFEYIDVQENREEKINDILNNKNIN